MTSSDSRKELDRYCLERAMRMAKRAGAMGEVPVGAVIEKDGKIIATAYNRKENENDPTAHAEILVLKKAGKKLGSWRLKGCTLYVTLEPCMMCYGAIIQSRVKRVVFAAADPKVGATRIVKGLIRRKRVNHAPQIQKVNGVGAGQMLKDFFKANRKNGKNL